MKLIWTPQAASELAEAVRLIESDNPSAAAQVVKRIYSTVMQLESMPHIGRHGKVPGTRELIFYPWKYIAVYRIQADQIRILRIRHSSRQWP